MRMAEMGYKRLKAPIWIRLTTKGPWTLWTLSGAAKALENVSFLEPGFVAFRCCFPNVWSLSIQGVGGNNFRN